MDGRPMRWRATRKTGLLSATQAAINVWTHANRIAHRPGSEHLQGPHTVEPAGLARASRKHYCSAGDGRISLSGVHLHSGHRSPYATAQEGRGGYGRPAHL